MHPISFRKMKHLSYIAKNLVRKLVFIILWVSKDFILQPFEYGFEATKTCFFTFLIVPNLIHCFWTFPLYPLFSLLQQSAEFFSYLENMKKFFLSPPFCIPNKNWMKKFLSWRESLFSFLVAYWYIVLALGLTLRSRKPIMDLITPLFSALWWSWTTFLCW